VSPLFLAFFGASILMMRSFPGGSGVKNLPADAGDIRDMSYFKKYKKQTWNLKSFPIS